MTWLAFGVCAAILLTAGFVIGIALGTGWTLNRVQDERTREAIRRRITEGEM